MITWGYRPNAVNLGPLPRLLIEARQAVPFGAGINPVSPFSFPPCGIPLSTLALACLIPPSLRISTKGGKPQGDTGRLSFVSECRRPAGSRAEGPLCRLSTSQPPQGGLGSAFGRRDAVPHVLRPSWTRWRSGGGARSGNARTAGFRYGLPFPFIQVAVASASFPPGKRDHSALQPTP